MRMYTSYFANMRNLPSDFCPIAICGGIPQWYRGKWTRIVAPKIGFFNEWKKNHDNDFYIRHFKDEVLSKLTPREFVERISEISEGMTPCLLCYEKPSDFCHRHLVAEWVNSSADSGATVEEFIPKSETTEESPDFGIM